jgi:amino acid adenylation domain-containing protein
MVVARTSGCGDVVFGSVVSGRLQGGLGTDRALGMFINMLPLRLRLAGCGVREMVRRTQEELAELLEYEQASPALAQRCSEIEGGEPLFTAVLNYRHRATLARGSRARVASAGAAQEIRVLGAEEHTNYPLMMSVDDLSEGFVLTAHTIPPIDAQRIAGYLDTALQSLVQALESTPARDTLELETLPPDELEQLLRQWAGLSQAYGPKCIHELFAQQVERSPEAAAVVYGDQQLTYRQLDEQSNQLGHYLQGLGVGPEVRVGLSLERSARLVVALLGIFKCGGVYVPLDPSYPRQRLELMLADAGVQVLLTRSGGLAAGAGSVRVCLDVQWPQISQRPAASLHSAAGSQNLAYVIYTSGSTGQPKGVGGTHEGAVNRILAQQAIDALQPQDVCCQKTSIGFVDSVFETLLPLVNGCTLVVVPDEAGRDPHQLIKVIAEQRITRLISVPTLARALAEVPEAQQGLAGVRSWTLSGEALGHRLPQILASMLPQCRLINLYGSSEVSADATGCIVEVAERRSEASAVVDAPGGDCIGRPLRNTQAYILDESLRPVPMGVAGELYIGGPGLARGYLERPVLTVERFIANPFGEPGDRLYRTGDRGRYRRDGSLEFLGRLDQQIKIRGFRVELEEIEVHLRRHPRVEQAVATVSDGGGSAEQRIVAYVTHRGDAPDLDNLTLHMSSALPHYMLPAAYVVLNELPLTSSGKVDRKGLPSPEEGMRLERLYEPPQSQTELVLAQIWRELLVVEKVGRRDNFFALGGHSMSALRLIDRVNSRFQVFLPLRQLFEGPTLQEVAANVERAAALQMAAAWDSRDSSEPGEEGVL